MVLLIATKNFGKSVEVRSILAGVPIELRTLLDFPAIETVDETANSYEENARLKASIYSLKTGLCSIADDSGLEVDALGGAPGVLSARYGEPGATDADRVNLLLSRLSGVTGRNRSARFRSVVALANERSEVLNVSSGSCEGLLSTEAKGTNGFGYDPIFIPHGYDQTFAQLSNLVKDRISHRAKALEEMKGFLLRYLANAAV